PAEKLRILLEISNSLSKALEIDALLPRIVENLFQLFKQADRGFILLREEASGVPVVRAFQARQASDAADPRYSASIVRRCLETVQAILGNDLVQQFPDSNSVGNLPVCSLMCAPLWTQEGEALGAIQLDAHGANKFSKEDLDL